MGAELPLLDAQELRRRRQHGCGVDMGTGVGRLLGGLD